MSWLATWDPDVREAWHADVADRAHMFRCRETFRAWLLAIEWVWGPPKPPAEPWRRLAPGSGR